ncbi:MAG: pectate lyase [Myxococcales bacterium]|nr:MAG: pectate lyase [Myxococcales bacterium]
MRLLWLVFAACSCRPAEPAAVTAPVPAPSAAAPAIPATRCEWARGWAQETRGGRGGQVLRVSTLSATGPGSLAEALAASGPRVIVFEVGGVIDLELATLKVREPFVTVAGQTAPSPGITLVRGGISVSTHDVVLQHLRVRPGAAGQPIGWEPDGISSSSGTHDFVVDHCSLTWAVDENLSASGSRFKGATPDEWRENTSHRVTFSHNIVAEGLAHATHEKGEHSKGSLIHDNVTGVLVFGNLYASNTERNPFFKGGARGVVASNWVVNPGKYAMKYTLVADEWQGHPPEMGQMAVVGNVLHYGKDTPAGMPLLFSSGIGSCDVFLKDNVALDRAGAAVPLLGGALENLRQVASAPVWPPGFVAEPARGLVERLATVVGARHWERDTVDARIVQQARDGSSAIIDSEQAVGGYPQVAATSAPFVESEWELGCMTRR